MRNLSLIALLALVAGQAGAKDIYVSPTGNDSSNGASSSTALRSIAAASKQAQAGDTVLLMPGRYNEAIVPARSGDTANPITYKSAGPGAAVLTSTRSKGLSAAISINGINNIIVDGVHVDGVKVGPAAYVDKFAMITNASRITIRNGNFKYANGWQGIGVGGGASRITIEDNVIDTVGIYDTGEGANSDVGDALEIRNASGGAVPEYVLVQRNTIKRGAHDVIRVSGRYCVIQDNILSNSFKEILGGDAGGRVGSILGEDNVVQRNYILESGKSSDSSTQVLFKIEGERNIARQNVLAYGYQDGFLTAAGDWSHDTNNYRIYNNTFYHLGSGAWLMESYQGASSIGDGVFANNAVVDQRLKPLSSSKDVDLIFAVRVMAGASPTARTVVRGNYFSPVASKSMKVSLLGFGGDVDMVQAETKYPALFSGNKQERVQFVSASPQALKDYDLKSGSPGIDGGEFLTTAVGSGTSKTLKVADSLYFTDGYGLIPGDTIQLQGSTERVSITKIDHGSKTLTLSANLTFKDGQGVSLAYNGAAPDVGAREFGVRAAPAPPRGIRAQ